MKKFFLTLFLLFFIQGNVYALDLSANFACIISEDTGEIIYSKNAHSPHPMASTTKIMTAIVVLENTNLDDLVTVSYDASTQEGSSIYLKKDEKITVENLLYGMMLNSGNDAAYALAEHISPSIEEFSTLMTDYAKNIGAKNTSFKNPNGLDAPGHISTAYDMALITSYALKNPTFREIVSTKNAQITTSTGTTYLKNHNKLLWNYDGCTGVKTGYTKNTGRCLVTAAERDGKKLIAVTLDAPDDWNDHKKLLDFGFDNTEVIKPLNSGDILKTYHIGKSSFNAVLEDSFSMCVKQNTHHNIDVKLHTIKTPTSKILKGEKIGYADIYINNEFKKSINLLSDKDFTPRNNANNTNFFTHLIKMIKILLLKM